MGYRRWNDMPEAEQELCSRVQVFRLTLSYNGKDKTIIRRLLSNYIGGSILSTMSYTKSTSATEVIKLLLQEGPRWQMKQFGGNCACARVARSSRFNCFACLFWTNPCHCKTRRIGHYSDTTILLAGSPLFKYLKSRCRAMSTT
ncbi:hypothetical protein I3843_01G037600 [Carya illinoinensis]|nr:hypothetical protein I3843_01G037600 [Carya illinoinensis]KAG7994076.1 hypothetical protein I3843_01G037600 [Carya illinoinensis]